MSTLSQIVLSALMPNPPTKLEKPPVVDTAFNSQAASFEFDRKQTAAIDSLLDLRRLVDNWDGEGSQAPLPAIVDSAIELIESHRFRESFPPPDRVTPRGEGQIALEWFIGQGYLSARIYAPGLARCLYRARYGVGEPDEFFSWDWVSNTQAVPQPH